MSWTVGTARRTFSFFINWPVDNTNANPRGLTNHAHNWNSNLRFDPFKAAASQLELAAQAAEVRPHKR